jgi:hypothetical protein
MYRADCARRAIRKESPISNSDLQREEFSGLVRIGRQFRLQLFPFPFTRNLVARVRGPTGARRPWIVGLDAMMERRATGHANGLV